MKRFKKKENRLRTSCASAVGRGDFKKMKKEEGAAQHITRGICCVAPILGPRYIRRSPNVIYPGNVMFIFLPNYDKNPPSMAGKVYGHLSHINQSFVYTEKLILLLRSIFPDCCNCSIAQLRAALFVVLPDDTAVILSPESGEDFMIGFCRKHAKKPDKKSPILSDGV